VERLERLLGFVRSRWALAALAVAALLLFVWQQNAARGALDGAMRAAAEADLRAKGELVEVQAQKAEVLAALEETSAELRAQVARIQELSRGARVARVIRGATAPAVVEGHPAEPRRQDEPPQGCLLSVGDLGEIVVEEAALETKGGAVVLVGQADAWRSSPLPRLRLFGGAFSAEVSRAAAAVPEGARRAPGWGGGAGVLLGGDGAVPALVLSPPPWHGIEVVGSGGVRFDGTWAAGLVLLWRP
jgi:multidrug efflux pump subunit AcrA (membrane-fusion protein)